MLALFYLFAAISVISALVVVGARNPVNSVIALVVCFLSIAGHYVLLNAQFLAMVHVIVYTGAIMVLFLFVIMLLNLNKATEPTKSLGMRVAGITSGGLLFITLAAAIRQGVHIQAANPFDLYPDNSPEVSPREEKRPDFQLTHLTMEEKPCFTRPTQP